MNETSWQRLADAAKAASTNAYCPYSGFRVGAAVLTPHGTVANGCNVENASFGLTVCAERNAIFRAVTDGATSIVALVLYTPTPALVTPCGACRQVIAEFGRDATIRCICDGADTLCISAQDLLPGAFTMDASR